MTAKDAAKLTSDADRIAYCVACGLNEPTILIDKIKIQTMFEFNGTLLSLSSMSGSKIIWRLARQNVQDEETERYLKKVINVVEKRKKDAKYSVGVNDGVSAEQNLILYNLIVETLLSPKYRGASSLVSFANKLNGESIRSKFASLSLVDQCVVLCECNKSLQCNAVASDLSLVGEGKRCGTIATSSTFETLAGISIVHRSITGVFEQKTPLVDFDK